MKRCNALSQLLLILVALCTAAAVGTAQVPLTTPGAPVTIDFTGYTGTGFSPTPAAGQLNSNNWAATGMSDGTLSFGGTQTGGDFARGTWVSGTTTGGFYLLNDAGNARFLIQPTGSDWNANGTLTLRFVNNTGSVLNRLTVAYDIFINNSGARANSFNFAYSVDGTNFTPVCGSEYTSPEALDAAGFVLGASRALSITNVNIPANGTFFIRWIGSDVSGSGNRDAFALDNIAVTPFVAGNPAVAISNYAFSLNSTAINSPATDLSTAVHGPSVDDALSAPISLPFTFYYNGQPYDRIVVSSNGWVALGNSTNSPVFPATMTSVPANDPEAWEFGNVVGIAPLWDNLRVASGGRVSYNSTASEFRVRWRSMEWPATSVSFITFELVLTPNCNRISFLYSNGSSSAQQSATVGLINDADNAAPNNYTVFNGNVTPGNLTSDANGNANTRLISYSNLPSGANPSIFANHYDALRVESANPLTFPAVDANGGVANSTVTVRNLGCNTITVGNSNIVYSNSQFTSPTFSSSIAPGATASVPVRFTGNCPYTACAINAGMSVVVGAPAVPVVYPVADNAFLALSAQESHPAITVPASLAAFPTTIVGASSTVTFTLTNTGNAPYTGSLSVSGNALDAAQFAFSPNPVTVPANGSTVVSLTFTPSGARHAANANAATWAATFSGLQVVVPNGNQTCSVSPLGTMNISANSTAPRVSINVPASTEITGNQGAPTLDLGNRAYVPSTGDATIPQDYSETFLVRNTGSAAVTISDIVRGATGNLADRFSASAARISGNATLQPGQEAVYRVTYTPTKTTSDFPYTQVFGYAGLPPANAYVTGNATYSFTTVIPNTPSAAVPAVAGFWHNYMNGSTSTYGAAENLSQLGTMSATIDVFRGYMRAVAAPSNASAQGPTNAAGAPVLNGTQLVVNGTAVTTNLGAAPNNLSVTSYYGAVGDPLPNGATVTNAGQAGVAPFYLVNLGSANARYYIRKTVINDNVNPGAFAISVPIPGDNVNPAASLIPIASETINGVDYHVVTLEPLYQQGGAGNSKAYVRFDVTFRPVRANTPSLATIAQLRSADIEILTDANMPTSAAASVEPRNRYTINVQGTTLFNDPAFIVDNTQVTSVDFGSHELADATSSNYPFGAYYPAGLGYNAPAGEIGRRGLSMTTGFGVRDSVITIAIENRGNAAMVFNNLGDLQAFALSGSQGTFSIAKITTQNNINSAGNAEPASVTFPFTLNTGSGNRLLLWVRYDAGTRSAGAPGLSNGTVRLVQSPLATPAPHTVSLSGSLAGRGIRPFPVVNIDGGNGGTTMIIDGTERMAPVHNASRPVIFDNYCNLGGVVINRDTVQIPLTIGNGIPAPTQAGGSLAFDNVNDDAVTDVVINMNNIVIDSLAGSLVIPGASTSYFVNYNAPVVIRNQFGTVVNTVNISNPANRLVTVGPRQTMTFSVVFRPTVLSAMPNSIQARVRVAHSSRNNNINFPADQGPSHTRNSNPDEFGDVYRWMDFVVTGSSLRPGFRLEAGNNVGTGMLGNFIAPNSTIDFNLGYAYQPGVFVGDSNWVALTMRNSQETSNMPTGADMSTGVVGVKAIYIEGVDAADFEFVGFDLPNSAFEPNPVAFPVRTGADNGSPIIAVGRTFIQWTASFNGSELGVPYRLDRNMMNMEDVNLYVHFKPRRTVNGAPKEVRNAVLRVVTTDICAPEVVYNLSGRALDSRLVVNKSTIDFGNVQVDDVAQQTFTITNEGNFPAHFNAGTVQSVFPSGPLYSHNFDLMPLGFSIFYAAPPYNYTIIGDMETPLNPGDSRTLAVQFAPSQGGRKDATINIGYIPEVPVSLENGNLAQINVVGRGVAPVTLVTSPASGILEFGNVVVGSTKTMPITITNTGQAALSLDLPPQVIGAFRHNIAATSTVLGAGQSVTVNFTFAPTTFGADDETFTITVPNGFGTSTVDIVVRGTGVSGAALSASALNFPVTRVFTESNLDLYVNNANSNSPSTFRFNGVSGLNSEEFELRMNGAPVVIGSTYTVPAGQNSATFQVIFKPNQLPANPSTANVRNASIDFTLNGTPVSVAASGEGAVPQISFTGTDIVNGELDFGSISGTAQRTVRVWNIGRFPLNVTQLLVMGDDAASFELGNVQDVVLNNGEWFEVRITLNCGGADVIEDARLTAISNSLQSRSVELSGACATAQIGLSATNLAFGRTEVGKTIEKTLTIRSASSQPLTVTGLAIEGLNSSEFAISSTSKTLPATISGSEELVVVVRFTPNAEGAKEARVRVVSSVGQTEIRIDGLATAPGTVVLSQQNLNFGSLAIGKSRVLSVNIVNHSAAPVLVNSVALEGDDRAMFSADNTAGFTLQPNESRTVRVTFTPSSNGSKFALIRFNTATGTQPVAALMGKGGSAQISVANVADFGNVDVNAFREMQIAVNSTGDEALVINSAYISGPSNAEFTVMTPMPLEIAAGQSANVTVRFMPANDGSKVAYLNLLSNSNAGTVELRGSSITTGVTGEEPTLAFGITRTFPNPFSETTTIAYNVSTRMNVTMSVFNQLGEKVATLFSGVVEAGEYVQDFKAGELPAGSYIVRLESGSNVATQKLTIVK